MLENKTIKLGKSTTALVIVAAAVVLLASLAVAYWTGLRALQANRQLGMQRELLAHLERVGSTLKDAETGQRGYLLTGQPDYLQPYLAALHALQGELNHLQNLAARSALPPARVAQVLRLSHEKLAELDQTVRLKQAGQLEAALAVVRSNRGKQLMDGLRTALAAMQAQVVAEFQTANRRAGQAAQQRILVLVGTTLLNLGFLVWAYRQIARQMRQREAAQEAVRQGHAQLNGIIASAMDAIISTDAQQRIVLFNPAAETIFGLPAAQVLGQSINRLIPERFRTAHTRHMDEFGHTGVSSRTMGHQGPLSGLRANGEEFPIESSISQTLVGGEKLFTVILRDITQRQRAEDALRQARDELARANADLERKVQERTAQLLEANANLQTFAYSAAHDLRSPLRSVHNFSSMLLQDFGPSLGPEGQMMLERVSGSALQMDRLVNDLLEYSKVSAAELPLQPLNLRQAVSEALSLVEAEVRAKQAVVTVLEPLPDVLGHHATVVLLLNNLLSNALKFHPPQVQPHIRLWAQEVRNEESQALKSDSALGPRPVAFVRLWVEDNGIGIDPKDAGKLFGAFQRLNSKQAFPGTGLGLAIVKKAVERLGGAVGVESQPGQGSRFWVELPSAR